MLSHTLAHALLNHNRERQFVQRGLMLTQMVILTLIDPTGIFSLAIEGALLASSVVRPAERMFLNSDQQHDADILGLSLASRSCYDPSEMLNFFRRLNAHPLEGKAFACEAGTSQPLLTRFAVLRG